MNLIKNQIAFELFTSLACHLCFRASQRKASPSKPIYKSPQTLESSERISNYQCQSCFKTYSSLRLLNFHRKIHSLDEASSSYCYNSRKKLFQCNTCLLEFHSKHETANHVEKSHSYQCQHCSEKFVKPFLLGCHMAEHNEDGNVSCPLCEHNFKTPFGKVLQVHINTKHLKKTSNYCTQCGASYVKKCQLLQHMKVVHMKQDPLKCVVCEKGFIMKSSLRKHQVDKHRVLVDGEIISNFCFLCKRTFQKLASLERHLEEKHKSVKKREKKIFVCDICGNEFGYRQSLLVHQKGHLGIKPYQCSYCSKSFKLNSHRIDHESVHTNLRRFTCDQCGKTFKLIKCLRLHLKMHQEVRDITCQFCGKGFYRNDHHMLHLKTCKRNPVNMRTRRRRGRLRKSKIQQHSCLKCLKVSSSQRLANIHKYLHVEASSFKADKTKNLFTCIFCLAKFQNKKQIKSHMNCHSMSCKQCHENFQNPFFLGLHMAEHDPDGKVFCPLCDYSGRLALAVKKHICSTHFGAKVEVVDAEVEELDDTNEEDEKNTKTHLVRGGKRQQNTQRKKEVTAKPQLICNICNKSYERMKELRNHRKVHKAERLETLYTFNPIRKSYSCDTCLQEFQTEEDIANHVDSHSYTCKICSVKFKKALLVGLHMAEHNEEGFVSCPLCNYDFKTRCKSRLIRHIKQTHQKERPKTSQCEYCGSSYLSKTMLEDHIRVVHLQKEPYKCIVCGNTFTLQSSMRIHQINKHRVVDESELSSNYCTLCKMSFKKPSSLAKHLEMKRCIPTPRVERQGHFVCDLCGKEFRFYKTFNLHQREHAGDKPYKCSFCPKSFVINSKRLAHEVSHTDLRPFSCETCGQNYKTWKHLRRHLVVHGTNPKVTFNCSFCGKEFSTKESQRSHMRICTKPEKPTERFG